MNVPDAMFIGKQLSKFCPPHSVGVLTTVHHFYNPRNMDKEDVVAALAALAQEHRLEVYRLLVQAGPGGMAAGEVASALGIPPNTLSFHFDRLRHAGLVSFERQGRSLIYSARYDTMNALIDYLTENCCGGKPELCKPIGRSTKRKKVTA
jgi:ArsR family transcriptional regulator, arsenate/arsenite/antimonite-responsive transcriptional repressor